MKLKCDKHDRRIHAVAGKFVHRNGEACDSKTAGLGDNTFRPDDPRFNTK
jgi:hypothetical protein